MVKPKGLWPGGNVKRLLTHLQVYRPGWTLAGLVACCTSAGGWAAEPQAQDGKATPPEVVVKIKAREFENRRAKDATLTWVLQNTTYEDGLRVITLAGVQFEENFGLTAVLLDDVAPEKTTRPQHTESQAQPVPPRAPMVDGAENTSDEPPVIQVQLRSLVVNVNELRSQAATRQSVPACDNDRRRAVVFIRPEQLRRQLEVSIEEAEKWTRFGRAACLRWESFPTREQVKTALPTDALPQPNEHALPN